MDKRTLLALVLIGALFLVWSLMNSFNAARQPAPTTRVAPTVADSAAVAAKRETRRPVAAPLPPRFDSLRTGNGRFITVITPLYTATINTQGAVLYRLTLTQYKSWYGAPTQLISDKEGFPGVAGITLKSSSGLDVETDQLQFAIDGPDTIHVTQQDSATLVARLAIPAADSGSPAGALEKTFVFRGNEYGIGFRIRGNGLGDDAGGGLSVTWRGGLKYQEHNSVEESNRTMALALVNDDLVELDNHEVGTTQTESFKGTVAWVGHHTKYFGAALIPSSPVQQGAVAFSGRARSADSSGMVETYDVSLTTPPSLQTASFTLFVGPLEYGATSAYNLQPMIDMGARFIIRPIGEFFMLPIFRFLHGFIGNYGLVIIVFSILIRLLLWPLTVPQMRSSRKMQLLQPLVTELREKHKDDSQRQQMETMKLYREYGINPVGGCLPMLLQMPILYALWGTLSSSIDLRQAGFALWIHDLSVPDYIIPLPFSLPLVGDKLAGLALVMGATLFIQQKMMISDPRQKAMIYFLPVLLTMTFNFLPSGLNLYYLSFNLVSIGQQLYYTKWSKSQPTLEQMREEAKGKKKGWLATKMEEAQKMAEQQKRMGVAGRTPVEPRRKK